ncbi:hypothetical protein V8G54_017086, partial [Vigna mungo]
YSLPYALLVSIICEYKGVNTSGEASQSTYNESGIGATSLRQIGFVLQGNTYIYRDDIGNSIDEDKDQQMADAPNIAGSSAHAPTLTSFSYCLESISRQLSKISTLQASRHEEVCSYFRNLDIRVQVLEDHINPIDDQSSDEF